MNRPFRKQDNPPPPALANSEVERAVLGRLLCDGRAWFDVADRLTPEHFADRRNRNIYKALQTLAARGSPLIKALVPSVIGSENDDDIGLVSYLAALVAEAPEGSIGEYVDAVLDAARRRHAIAESEWLADQMRGAELGRSIEIISEAQRRLQLVGTDPGDEGLKFNDVLERVVGRTNEIRMADGPAGIETGLTAFDELVGPLMPGQLIVIAGSAGMGKTSLALQVAIMVAQKSIPVKVFSLEMQAQELGVRTLATFAEIAADKITEANLTDFEMERLIEMQQRVSALPILVDDRPGPTTATLLSRAARDQIKHEVRLFMTDHMRMVRADNLKAEERVRLEQIVQDHKSMAKRLGVPWVLLSHTHRADYSTVKTAKDIRRPMMHNLYGSSAVENSADAVVFVHRPSVILADVKPDEQAKHYAEWEADLLAWEGKAELILGKHRSRKGRGIRTVKFDDSRTWFS